MALSGVRHLATGTAVQLSTLIPQIVKQVDIIAAPANAANIYIGTSGVSTAGAEAFICLAPGQAWSAKADRADKVSLGDLAYIIGTTSDVAHISYLT